VPCKIVREKSGIPYSTRNFLLNSHNKKIASRIFKLIKVNKKKIIKKIISIKQIKNIIYLNGADKIDYIEILDVNKIIKPYKKDIKYKIFLAYYLGNTRLIDNI